MTTAPASTEPLSVELTMEELDRQFPITPPPLPRRGRPPKKPDSVVNRYEPGFVWWYESIIDFMIAYPNKTLKECAAHIGRSERWIHYVTKSDSFQTRLKERRELHGRQIAERLHQRLAETAIKAVDVLNQKLDNPARLDTETVVAATDTLLERLGYGVNQPVPGPSFQQQNNFFASPADLQAAQSTIRELERLRQTSSQAPAKVIDARPSEPASD